MIAAEHEVGQVGDGPRDPMFLQRHHAVGKCASPRRAMRRVAGSTETTTQPIYCRTATVIASAVRNASAAMVKVGLAVPDVGNRDEPANQRLGWS